VLDASTQHIDLGMNDAPLRAPGVPTLFAASLKENPEEAVA
jgi:hypothetical protein